MLTKLLRKEIPFPRADLPLSTGIDSLRSRGGPISIPLPKTLTTA